MNSPSRREALKVIAGALGASLAANEANGHRDSGYQLTSFREDVTPPVGNPLFNGLPERATAIVDPLEAHGVVLTGAGKPIVMIAVDWCEIRNESYERWRDRKSVV